ncbi:TSCPD domain-containing protein, partial [Dysosmobacter welbionis]
CGPGGDPPHRGYCARRALQGRHAAPHQQVDVIVGVCGAQAPQPPDLRPVERHSRVPSGGDDPCQGRCGEHAGQRLPAAVQGIGPHQ